MRVHQCTEQYIASVAVTIVGEVRRVVFHIDSTGIISELHFMLHWTTHCSMQIAISRRPGWCWWSIRQALSVCLSLTQTVTLSADPYSSSQFRNIYIVIVLQQLVILFSIQYYNMGVDNGGSNLKISLPMTCMSEFELYVH